VTTLPGTQQRHADTYRLRHLGLNGMDYLLLSACAKQPCARPAEIALRIGRSANHVANVASYLVRDGFLERQRGGLMITAYGKRALAQARDAIRATPPAVHAPLMLGTPPTHALRDTSRAARAAQLAAPQTPLNPDAPLWTLALPVKVHNRLRRAGIHTVAELMAASDADLRSRPGIGDATLPAILSALVTAGLRDPGRPWGADSTSPAAGLVASGSP